MTNRVRTERGGIVLMGGSEHQQINPELIRRTLDLTEKGPETRVGIIASASESPTAMATRYIAALSASGIHAIRILDPAATDPSGTLESLDILLFTGGDQLRLLEVLFTAAFRKALTVFHHRGGVIAGSSAGAMVMGNPVIVRGDASAFAEIGALQFREGFDLVEDAIIDTHLVHRNRLGRLLHAASVYPGKTAIGIQEGTGLLIVPGQPGQVIGEGIVVSARSSALPARSSALPARSSALPDEEAPESLERTYIHAENLHVSIYPRSTHIHLPLPAKTCSRP